MPPIEKHSYTMEEEIHREELQRSEQVFIDTKLFEEEAEANFLREISPQLVTLVHTDDYDKSVAFGDLQSAIALYGVLELEAMRGLSAGMAFLHEEIVDSIPEGVWMVSIEELQDFAKAIEFNQNDFELYRDNDEMNQLVMNILSYCRSSYGIAPVIVSPNRDLVYRLSTFDLREGHYLPVIKKAIIEMADRYMKVIGFKQGFDITKLEELGAYDFEEAYDQEFIIPYYSQILDY